MKKSKSMVWRSLLVLFIAFLWGGGVGAYAANKAWVKYANGTLTFQYSEKGSLDEGEYDLNSGESLPGWNDVGVSISKVVFDSSFADARPTTCHSWFSGLENLTVIEGMENLNTSEVTSMYQMFSGCKSLPSLDLSHFATQKVKTMSYMFMGCESLESLDLNSFNTAMVETMGYMFSGCTNLVTLDLTSFNTQCVISTRRMFSNDSKLKTVYASDNFSLKSVTSEKNHQDMFAGCVSLEGERKFVDNGRTDKVFAKSNDGYFLDKTMYRPWAEYGDGTLTFYYGYKRNIYSDQYKLYTSGRQWKPGWISDHSTEIKKVVFDKSFAEARPTYCYGWFSGCENLTEIVGSMYLNTSEVYDMGSMFEGCTALTSLDLSHFDTQKVTDMSYMFYGCSKLNAIYWADKFDAAQLSSIDNSDMFYQCPAILYCSPNQYESFKNNSVIASAGNAVKPYVGINQKSEYGTLCVPVGSSLAEGSFTGFDKLYQVQDADKDKGTITLVESKSIEPGVPYIYHRYLEGVDFESKAEESSESTSRAKAPVMSVITFDVDKNASAAVTAPKNEGSLLKGTFESMLAIGGSYILQTDGNFHPVTAYNRTLKVGAYRAYLDLSSTEVGGGDEGFGDAKAYRMVFEDGEATGINRIDGESSDKGVYAQADQQPKVYFDLMGRKVAAPQKGEIYIVNGKKVVYNK